MKYQHQKSEAFKEKYKMRASIEGRMRRSYDFMAYLEPGGMCIHSIEISRHSGKYKEDRYDISSDGSHNSHSN